MPGTASERASHPEKKTLDDIHNCISSKDLEQRRLQLDRIVSNGLKRIEEKKTKYHIAGHEFVVQEQIAKAAELLQWGKEWINDAVQASPQALIAWAAVCIALPLLTKPAAAEQANKDGFDYVTARMRYYVALESLMLPQSQASTACAVSEDLKNEFEAHVVDLYQNLLNFQIRSVLRFYRSALGNFGRDLIQKEDWKQMQENIKYLEKIINNDSQHISTLYSRKTLEDLAKNAEKYYETMYQSLTVAEQHLQVGKEQRDIAVRQLSAQKEHRDISVKMLQVLETKDEKECFQLFRLQRSEGDQSYEWYKGQVEERVEGTCQWFLDHDHYRKWLGQDSGPLLVSADPGCGKSVLAKYLIDHELPRSSTICYFFFKDQVQNTLKQALCALLHQLLSARPALIRYALSEYIKNGPGLVNNVNVLWDILCKAGRDPEMGPVIFVLDALDECHEPDFRNLVRMLKPQLQKEEDGFSKMKFLLTSRPYDQITSEFQELVDAFPYIRIPGEEESERIGQEVNYVIKYRVQQLAKEKELTDSIQTHLEQRLLGISHRTYLWVYLVFDYLKQVIKKTKKTIDAVISTLPKSVNQAYEKILNRSKEEDKVRKTLSIILAANRPLTLKEMNVAVNIESSPRSTSEEDLDLEEEKDFKQTLRNWCGLFISIYHNKVYFLHQTAREFLIPRLSSPVSIPQNSQWCGTISLHQAHSLLAEICTIYLDFRNFEYQCPSDQNKQTYLNNFAFLEYSAENWAAHLRHAYIENQEDSTSTILKLCNPDTKRHNAWFKIYWKANHNSNPTGFNALILVSYFGFQRVVDLLLEKGADADVQHKDGWTALHWAAENGHEAVVRLLVEREDVEAYSKDNNGRTPLSLAAERRYR